MARLSKDDLLSRILSPIRAAGWNVIFVSRDHPFDLVIFKDEQSFRVRLYVWNVTHGGGARRAPEEYRIQITGVTTPLTGPPGFQTLLFGWYEELGVVAAFDPERHRQPSRASPSIQIHIDTLQAAAARGLAVQSRGNEEIALAFNPELLITYIENQTTLHHFAGDDRDIDLLIAAGAGEQIPETELEETPAERERVIRMVSTRRREASFRRRVLLAYGHTCAVCHLQLDLVEGAHIVPVGAPGSTDETSNGLALCALHHEAYDDALIGVDERYRVLTSEARIRALRDDGRGGMEDRFRRDLQPRIILPSVVGDRPRAAYLREALRVRGW